MNAPVKSIRRGPPKGVMPCAASLANLRKGSDRRGRIADPVRAHRLIRWFVAEMNKRRLTFLEIAAGAGCSKKTPSQWRYARTPQIDLFDEACAVMGLELAIRTRRKPYEAANEYILGAMS